MTEVQPAATVPAPAAKDNKKKAVKAETAAEEPA